MTKKITFSVFVLTVFLSPFYFFFFFLVFFFFLLVLFLFFIRLLGTNGNDWIYMTNSDVACTKMIITVVKDKVNMKGKEIMRNRVARSLSFAWYLSGAFTEQTHKKEYNTNWLHERTQTIFCFWSVGVYCTFISV